MASPSIANTFLCLFSKDKCIIIDDCNKKFVGVYSIANIWKDLPNIFSMKENVDAAYFCPEYKQLAFFQKDQFAVQNYETDTWKYGPISKFFSVPAGSEDFYNGVTAASTGVREQNICLYREHQFICGPISDVTTGNKLTLSGLDTLENNGWTGLKADQVVVASTLMCRTTGQYAGNPSDPVRTLFYLDTDGNYYFTFDNTHSPLPIIHGSFPLTDLWSGFDSKEFPISAATRVDPSLIKNVSPNPLQPGPVLPHNSLCDELPNIMKSVCSLTVLMHKVIDACYPQSAWPTEPYPDGCSTPGNGCGCKGKGNQGSGNQGCGCKGHHHGHHHHGCGCKGNG